MGRGRPHAHPKRVLQRRHAVGRHQRQLPAAQLPVRARDEGLATAGHAGPQVHPLHVAGAHGHQAK